MNVVVVDGDVSYPPTSGKRLRTLNLLLPLAGRHNITYIGRGAGNAELDRAAIQFFASKNIKAIIVDDPIPKKSGLGFYLRLVKNLGSSLPYSVASHYSPKMREAVQRHAAANQVDLWQVEWSGYLYSVAGHPTPVVLQAHNVDTLIWQRSAQTEKGLLKRWYFRGQWKKFEAFERSAFHQVKRIVAVSQEDETLAKQLFGPLPIDVVDNGVDVQAFSPVRADVHSRSILYLGALDWRPNQDALQVMLDAIFPRIRAQRKDTRLIIVGRQPPEWLRTRVANEQNVELHADVPDVKEYLAKSLVMAVPLRIGGGSRLKILESLAAGLPVVSTKVGAEGLAIRPKEDYTLADDPEEFTAALLECLANPQEAIAQAERGRQVVSGRYDWSSLACLLERVWERAAGIRTP